MKERSRTEYSLINMFTGMAGYGINTVAGFVCRIIFVRTLSADYLGVNGLFTNILSMLSLAELGISSAIVYALYKPLAENDEAKVASIMNYYRKAYMAIGCVVAAVGLALIPFLDLIITDPPSIKESIYVLYLLYLTSTTISYFFSYRQSLLTAAQRQYIVSGYNYVITIAQSILQIGYLMLTREYIGYLLIQIAGGIIYNVWVSHKASKDYPYIKKRDADPLPKEERHSLFRNIKALAVNKVSGVLVNSTDNIAITYFMGLSSVGFASNYTLFASTLNSFVTLLFNGLTGSVGNLNASTDEDTRYRFFKSLSLSNFWIYGWAGIGMTFVSGDLVAWFYGGSYVLPMEIPLLLALNFYTIGVIHACYTFKSTLGLFRYGQYILLFTGCINLLLDILLGRKFGIAGIYLATLLARLCTNLWYEPYAVYRYGFRKPFRLYIKDYCTNTLVVLAAGIACWAGCSLCHFNAPVNALVKAIICTVIPNATFYLAFHKKEEGRYLIDRVHNIVIRLVPGGKK
jgi:O-antigen/teichoic acid export membrane protein